MVFTFFVLVDSVLFKKMLDWPIKKERNQDSTHVDHNQLDY